VGVIACGHEITAQAAEQILLGGGNAFDAIVAAHFAACSAEPVLASLGGGGYLLACTGTGEQVVYDFFVQTPQQFNTGIKPDFFPITADFGIAQQEFHIGLGSIATPGSVLGMFSIHRDLCSMPMARLMEPAIEAARSGVEVNAFQSYILDIVSPVFFASQEATAIFGNKVTPGKMVQEGKILQQLQLADTLEALAHEGDRLFYEGDIAKQITHMCEEGGGLVTCQDLASYQVHKRRPLKLDYHNVRLLTNPAPASGGLLIAFALKLLEDIQPASLESDHVEFLHQLISVMDVTNKARIEAHLDNPEPTNSMHILDDDFLDNYRNEVYKRMHCMRGTTHMSVMDAMGNIASMTVSNGEGCGHILPGTGIMLNNMLGEEDLNPTGFHQWQTNQRMTSMMAPTIIIFPDGKTAGLGSGGSNRLRTAILQVAINLIDFGMSLDDAVNASRVHYEGGLLSIEGGFDNSIIEYLSTKYERHEIWQKQNLFFGGVHSVINQNGNLTGAGDPRRGGVAIVVEKPS
jgi:gamma-glutamyltranspeptidase/glutathione hydrolase